MLPSTSHQSFILRYRHVTCYRRVFWSCFSTDIHDAVVRLHISPYEKRIIALLVFKLRTTIVLRPQILVHTFIYIMYYILTYKYPVHIWCALPLYLNIQIVCSFILFFTSLHLSDSFCSWQLFRWHIFILTENHVTPHWVSFLIMFNCESYYLFISFRIMQFWDCFIC